MRVAGKVIVVTGAGSGIGKALAMELLARGAKVAAVDLRAESLEKLQADSNSDDLSVHTADISDTQAVISLPDEIVKAQGSVDAIINNAGIIQPFVKINDLDEATIERVMNINFYGTLRMVKAFLPLLLTRPEGHIVNISSMGGFLPVPGQSVYGASKAAVKLLTEGLYAELLDTNVGVTVVFPGATATNITDNSGVTAPKMPVDTKNQAFKPLPADQAARLIIDGMEHKKFQVFTGKDSRTMNRLYRLNPTFATKLIAKQMRELLTPKND